MWPCLHQWEWNPAQLVHTNVVVILLLDEPISSQSTIDRNLNLTWQSKGSSKPYHIGIHMKDLEETFHMNTYM